MGSLLRLRDRLQQRGSRGAVAVEAALILPIFLMLVFGIIEFGFAFKDWLAVTSSVRAGARIASAEPRTASFAQDAANQVAHEGAALDLRKVTALWVYEANVDGTPTGGPTCASACVKFTWNNVSRTFVKQAGTDWLSTAQNACPQDNGHDSVGVYLATKNTSITGWFLDDVTLSSRTVMSLEPIPTTSGCK